jgi:hypothetical protein
MVRFLKGLRPELKTILASQDFLSFSHLSNKAIQVKRAREEEKGHLKRNFKFSELNNRIGIRGFDLFGSLPRGRTSANQQDLLYHVSTSLVKVPSTPSLFQAANLQPMLVGTVETQVTSRIIAHI